VKGQAAFGEGEPMGFKRAATLLSSWARGNNPPENKENAELDFQKQWAKFDWSQIIEKLRTYWETYRYFDEITGLVKPDGKRILDVGCGVVSVLNLFPSAQGRVGIDPLMDSYLKLYSLDTGVNWLAGGAESLRFDDGAFDLVFCSNVLDHVEDPAKALSEISRVLCRDGRFVFSVDVFPQPKPRDKAHPHAFTRDRLHRLLSQDFEIIMEKISTSSAQVYNFINGAMRQSDVHEVIGVAAPKA